MHGRGWSTTFVMFLLPNHGLAQLAAPTGAHSPPAGPARTRGSLAPVGGATPARPRRGRDRAAPRRLVRLRTPPDRAAGRPRPHPPALARPAPGHPGGPRGARPRGPPGLRLRLGRGRRRPG